MGLRNIFNKVVNRKDDKNKKKYLILIKAGIAAAAGEYVLQAVFLLTNIVLV